MDNLGIHPDSKYARKSAPACLVPERKFARPPLRQGWLVLHCTGCKGCPQRRACSQRRRTSRGMAWRGFRRRGCCQARQGEARHLGEVGADTDRVRPGGQAGTAPRARAALPLRGRADRPRLMPPADQAGLRLHRGRAFADPAQARRPGQDGPARRAPAHAPAARWRADGGVAQIATRFRCARRGARGRARPDPSAAGGGGGPAAQTAGDLVHDAARRPRAPGQEDPGCHPLAARPALQAPRPLESGHQSAASRSRMAHCSTPPSRLCKTW